MPLSEAGLRESFRVAWKSAAFSGLQSCAASAGKPEKTFYADIPTRQDFEEKMGWIWRSPTSMLSLRVARNATATRYAKPEKEV
jgi:hypothetical protein